MQRLKAENANKLSENNEMATVDINKSEEFEYKIETNNNFKVLANPKHPNKCTLKKGGKDSKQEEIKSKSSREKKIFVDKLNSKKVFRDFLETFGDEGLDTAKYLLCAREMINKKYNTMHIILNDVRKYNPILADFIFKEQITMYSDICFILKSFIEDHRLDNSTQDIFFSLIQN